MRVCLAALVAMHAAVCGAAETTRPTAPTVLTVESTLTASQPSAYVHERFSLELEIRSQGVRLAHAIRLDGLPAATRARTAEPEELAPSATIAHGSLRKARKFRIAVLPLESGRLRFNPSVHVTVLQRSAVGDADEWHEVPYVLYPEPVSVSVDPLPTSESTLPFSGVVGRNLDLRADLVRLDRDGTGLFRLTTTLAGDGYFETLVAPRVTDARHFRIYAATPVGDDDAGVRHEQYLVAQKSGTLTIPAVTLRYFDTGADDYHTLTAGPFQVEVPTPMSTAEVNSQARTGTLVRTEVARIAPYDTARPVLALPAGRPVTILTTHGDWYRVRTTGPSGWIRADAVGPR